MTSRIRLSIRKRAEFFASKGGVCALCGEKIRGKVWQLDHIIPLEMGGDDKEDNWQVVHESCHRTKTRKDVGDIAKSNRIRARHMGIRRPVKFRGWRKFDGTIRWADERNA